MQSFDGSYQRNGSSLFGMTSRADDALHVDDEASKRADLLSGAVALTTCSAGGPGKPHLIRMISTAGKNLEIVREVAGFRILRARSAYPSPTGPLPSVGVAGLDPVFHSMTVEDGLAHRNGSRGQAMG